MTPAHPFRTTTLAPGTDLWRGTRDPDDWQLEGFGGWFTDNAYTARRWAELAGSTWFVAWFSVKRPVEVLHLRDFEELDRLAVALGLDEASAPFYPAEVVDALCAWGFKGWFIEEGDHEGADVFLCDPTQSLEFIRVVEESAPPRRARRPTKRRRPNPPFRGPAILSERTRRGDALRSSRAPDLETERFAAAVRRDYRRQEKILRPLLDRAPAQVQADAKTFVAWLNRQAPGSFDRALRGVAGRPLRARVVTPVESLGGLPRIVWHGTTELDRLLLDGVRSPPAIDLGRRGKKGWGWAPRGGGYAWAPIAWRWYQGLSEEGRASLERQTGVTIRARDDLGRAISLLFVMTADPLYASAYTRRSRESTPTYGMVAELDTHRLPVLGHFEDPYVMGDPRVLVLPARGYQGGPDAVVALREP